MLYSKAPSVVEHSGPFPEISHRFVLLCGREEVNGNESTLVEKDNTIDPQKPYLTQWYHPLWQEEQHF